jgi:hypothetical protein
MRTAESHNAPLTGSIKILEMPPPPEEVWEFIEWAQKAAERMGREETAICSRCNKDTGSPLPDDGATAGYYVAAGWLKFANPDEKFICDSCMWSDPRYIAIYGTQTS